MLKKNESVLHRKTIHAWFHSRETSMLLREGVSVPKRNFHSRYQQGVKSRRKINSNYTPPRICPISQIHATWSIREKDGPPVCGAASDDVHCGVVFSTRFTRCDAPATLCAGAM